MTLDDARAQNPLLGFAVYAYEAQGPVTLEIHAPTGQMFSFTGPTEETVLARAFPAPAAPEPTDIFS